MKKTKLTKVLTLVIVAPVGLLLVNFSVINRHQVLVDFWPLPSSLHIPLSAIILGALVIGVIWGGLASWFAAGTGRRRARDAARRADSAEAEARQLKDRVSRLETEVQGAKKTETADNTRPVPALPPANAA